MAGSKRLYKIELHKNSLLTQTCPEVELLMKEMKDGVSRENMLKRDWNRGAGIGIGIGVGNSGLDRVCCHILDLHMWAMLSAVFSSVCSWKNMARAAE